eukprot:Gregarina_sp_Poly_1__9441@NODE_591_length_7352_cov_125_609883_g456_i0_p3_GENE_NODE_591_length_7352_cov_125_609883_g456_i0NODE_591_length_7352_cov_125_609883_g456_i0_p3_ORF_typecomplete_len353_score40_85DUF1998/PF09369_10/9_5e07_NODE_591_length_7352_cov_125_609883_g456_i036974755
MSKFGEGRKFQDPHPLIDLRSSGIPNVSIYVVNKNTESWLLNHNYEEAGGFIANKMDGLTQVDETTLWDAWYQLYPGAVYPIRGKDLLVKIFNYRERYVVASEEQNLKYLTSGAEVHSYRLIKAERVLTASNFKGINKSVQISLGPLRVMLSIPYYWHLAKDGSTKKQGAEKVELSLPDLAFDTRGFVIDLSESVISRFFQLAEGLLENPYTMTAIGSRASDKQSLLMSAIHGLGHALTKTATTVVWCDLRELECNCASPLAAFPTTAPKIYLYERPSSIALGIADIFFRDGGAKLAELLEATKRVFGGCGCAQDTTATGCLDCVLLPYCLERNAMVHGKAAFILLQCLLEQ